MLNKLFAFIFTLILKIFNIITMPFFLLLYSLFPDISTYVSYCTEWITKSMLYVNFFTQYLFIPVGWWSAVFTYFTIKYTIFITARAFKFGIMIYEKFKP